jgi:hypothetical protein
MTPVPNVVSAFGDTLALIKASIIGDNMASKARRNDEGTSDMSSG